MGIADAIDSDHFEHFLPDMKAMVEIKMADIDTFMAGHGDVPPSQQARPGAQGR